jgi:hypothetical protein
MWCVEIKIDTDNNRGNWNHLKVISENTRATYGESTKLSSYKNSHSRHCTHTAVSADGKVYGTYLTREITLHIEQIVNTE